MVSVPARVIAQPQLPARSTTLAGAAGLSLAATAFAPAADASPESALLYAHGFGQTRGAWLPTGSALAARGHAGLAYDARGHGESARNAADQAYTGEQFTDDLIIVAGEHAQPPVLVGASMGGLFGMLAEARWPGLFRAMVLVDITPRWEQAGMQRILAFMTAFPEGFDSLDHAGDVIAAYLPQRRSRKSHDELRTLLREGGDRRWRWHWDARLIDDLVRDSSQHHDDIADAARTLRCPVLLISGGRSDLVSASTVEEFQALVPHAAHVHLAHATHMLAGDDNDAFTSTVLEYLAGLGTARAGTPTRCQPAAAEGAATMPDPGARP